MLEFQFREIAPRRAFPSGLVAGGRYLYPFRVEVSLLPEALAYDMTLADSCNHRVIITSTVPTLDLTPIWPHLSPGYVRYNIWAREANGRRRNAGRFGVFIKGTTLPEAGVSAPKMSWADASHLHWNYLHHLTHPDAYDAHAPVWLWHCVIRPASGDLYRKAYPGLHYPFHLWSLMLYQSLNPSAGPAAAQYIRQIIRFNPPCSHTRRLGLEGVRTVDDLSRCHWRRSRAWGDLTTVKGCAPRRSHLRSGPLGYLPGRP